MPTSKKVAEPVSKGIDENKLQPEITENAIRSLAYEIFISRQETGADGSAVQDWYNAEAALAAEAELIDRALMPELT